MCLKSTSTSARPEMDVTAVNKKRLPDLRNLAALSDGVELATTLSLSGGEGEAPYLLAQRRSDQEHERVVQSQKQGKIGRLVGDGEHAAVYAIGLVTLFVVLALIGLAFIDAGLRLDVFDLLSKLVLTALGFLGGLLTKLGR